MKKVFKYLRSKLTVLLGLGFIIIALFISITLAGMKKPPERVTESNEAEKVPVMIVENKSINYSVPIVGKLSAKEKIDIYSEVSGILENGRKDFLEGSAYNKGETMLKINSDETYMSLVSSRSSLLNLITKILPELKFDYPESYEQWKEYLDNFDIEKTTQELPDPLNNQEKYFVANQNIYQTYYTIKSTEIRLEKYNIDAPFNGVVIESNIKPGTLIMNGQKLGSLFNPGVYELEADVDIHDIALISIGDTVHLYAESFDKKLSGTIARVSQSIDDRTQTVKVFINVKNNNLKEGLFLSGEIVSNNSTYATEIPRKYLVDDEKAYVVKDSVLQSKDLNVIQLKESTAIINGLDNGTMISKKIKNLEEGILVEPFMDTGK